MESIENDTHFWNLSLLVEIIGCLSTTRKLSARIWNLRGIASQQCASHVICQSTHDVSWLYKTTSYYILLSNTTCINVILKNTVSTYVPNEFTALSSGNISQLNCHIDQSAIIITSHLLNTKNKHLFRLLSFVHILRQ